MGDERYRNTSLLCDCVCNHVTLLRHVFLDFKTLESQNEFE